MHSDELGEIFMKQQLAYEKLCEDPYDSFVVWKVLVSDLFQTT